MERDKIQEHAYDFINKRLANSNLIVIHWNF